MVLTECFKHMEKHLVQYHLVSHKTHRDWAGIEPNLPSDSPVTT
jgi:hypothetical protein